MNYLLAFCVSFVYVALKAFQQLNVQYDKYWWIMPVSLCMAVCEVTIVWLIVKSEFILALPIGLGAGLGAVVAMKFHKRLRGGQ